MSRPNSLRKILLRTSIATKMRPLSSSREEAERTSNHERRCSSGYPSMYDALPTWRLYCRQACFLVVPRLPFLMYQSQGLRTSARTSISTSDDTIERTTTLASSFVCVLRPMPCSRPHVESWPITALVRDLSHRSLLGISVRKVPRAVHRPDRSDPSLCTELS